MKHLLAALVLILLTGPVNAQDFDKVIAEFNKGVAAYNRGDYGTALQVFKIVAAQTGFFSPEVDALLRRFPAHLVNGEPLLEIKNRRDPRNRQPQTPRLVEVPQL